MNKPNIQTTKQVVPMLYGYSTPEVIRHNGWTKIGYTEQDVETRINQQTHTADIKWQLEWKGNATFDDGSGETFIDKDFHAYLRKSGIEQEKGKNNEWFHVDGATSKQQFFKITLPLLKPILQYTLVTSAIGGLQMYDIPQLFNEGNPVVRVGGSDVNSTTTVVMLIKKYVSAGPTQDYGKAAAYSVMLFAFTLIISLLFYKLTSEKTEKQGK